MRKAVRDPFVVGSIAERGEHYALRQTIKGNNGEVAGMADLESKQAAEKTSRTNAGEAAKSGSGTEEKASRGDTMSNPKMGPNETITGLELLMKLSPKDQKKLISKLLNGELPIDRGSKTQQKPSPASEKPPSS